MSARFTVENSGNRQREMRRNLFGNMIVTTKKPKMKNKIIESEIK